MADYPTYRLHPVFAGFHPVFSLPQCRRDVDVLSQAAASASKDSQKQIPCNHAITRRARHGMPDKSNFSDVVRNPPFRRDSARKKYSISGRYAAFFLAFRCHKCLAGHNHKRFVLVVMPIELADSTIPDHGVAGLVLAAREFFAASFGFAAE